MTRKQRLLSLPFIIASCVYAGVIGFGLARRWPALDPLRELAFSAPVGMLLVACGLIIVLHRRAFFWSKLATAATVVAPTLFICFRGIFSTSDNLLFSFSVLVVSAVFLSIAFVRYRLAILIGLLLLLLLFFIMVPPVWIALFWLLYLSLLEKWTPEEPARTVSSQE